jgi:hypothetical protein
MRTREEEIRDGLPTGKTFRAQHPEHVSLSGVQHVE